MKNPRFCHLKFAAVALKLIELEVLTLKTLKYRFF